MDPVAVWILALDFLALAFLLAGLVIGLKRVCYAWFCAALNGAAEEMR